MSGRMGTKAPLVLVHVIAAWLAGCGRTALHDCAVDDAGLSTADRPTDARSPLGGLRIAFVGGANPNSEASLLTWLAEITGVATTRILVDHSALTAALPANYDVLILERLVRSYGTNESALLSSWVGGGGAVLSVAGFFAAGTDTAYSNSLLAGIGLAYGDYVLGGEGGPAMTSDLANHPIMAGITGLPFWGGFTVAPSAGADGLGKNAVLAWSESQVVGIAQERGAGRVVVWGDEWIEMDPPFDTDDVRRFWRQALTWLARR
jgi:hypothetical protein